MVDHLFDPDDTAPPAVFRDDPTPNPRRSRPAGEGLHRSPRELARTDDVETSHAAAAANPGGKASDRRACLEAHSQAVALGDIGLTDDEVATVSGLDLQAARRRCVDLRKLDPPLIEWLWTMSDGFVTRPSAGGRRSRVSVITPAGREALR